MNVDSSRTNESINALIHYMDQNNIGIAGIQETQLGNNVEIYQNYHISYGGACRNATVNNNNHHFCGGVAVAGKDTHIHNIKSIRRMKG